MREKKNYSHRLVESYSYFYCIHEKNEICVRCSEYALIARCIVRDMRLAKCTYVLWPITMALWLTWDQAAVKLYQNTQTLTLTDSKWKQVMFEGAITYSIMETCDYLTICPTCKAFGHRQLSWWLISLLAEAALLLAFVPAAVVVSLGSVGHKLYPSEAFVI